MQTSVRWLPLSLVAILAAFAGAQTQPEGVVLDFAGGQAQAAFPGENGRIAFHSDRTGNYEVYKMNADGTSVQNLTQNNDLELFPAFSADGSKIAFTRHTGFEQNHTMNADGKLQTRISYGSVHHEFPSWSPDGTKIVFVSISGDSDIHVMNADGTGEVALTVNAIAETEPVWSPDGTKIAFERSGEIFVMNADGTNQTNITNLAGIDRGPDWSPDGTKIAFATFRTGNQEIFTMNADGSNPVNISNHANGDTAPAWSPDGTRIAFVSDRVGNQSEIFTMNADGTAQTNISNNPNDDNFPDWQPLSPVSIRNVGQYALPKSCFQVRNTSQVPFFSVCDNDFQGPPEIDPTCLPDGSCNDEDPAPGSIQVTVTPGDYRVVETAFPANHTPDASKKPCDTNAGCLLTFVNSPNNDPWLPWDVNGNGAVAAPDIFQVVTHFGETKP
jgi:TolB protein